jgi:uracil-DNA glycosylase
VEEDDDGSVFDDTRGVIAPPAASSVPDAPATDPARRLHALQRRHRACTRCADAGWLPAARPVFSGSWGQRVMLVGQAPGPVEHEVGQPFSGRAGRQLMRWLQRAGFAGEEDVRCRIYFISATTCFHGRPPGGAGDRRPTPREVAPARRGGRRRCGWSTRR